MTDYKFSEMTLEEKSADLNRRFDELERRITAFLDQYDEHGKRIETLEENQDTFAKKWYTDKKSNTKL